MRRENSDGMKSYCDCCQKAFRHVRHDDTDQKDDRFYPLVAKRKSNNEERHAKKNGDGRNDVNKTRNFFSDWSF